MHTEDKHECRFPGFLFFSDDRSAWTEKKMDDFGVHKHGTRLLSGLVLDAIQKHNQHDPESTQLCSVLLAHSGELSAKPRVRWFTCAQVRIPSPAGVTSRMGQAGRVFQTLFFDLFRDRLSTPCIASTELSPLTQAEFSPPGQSGAPVSRFAFHIAALPPTPCTSTASFWNAEKDTEGVRFTVDSLDAAV